MTNIGVVAIGRNEGERLRRCLSSVIGRAAHVVYVDSGSTDGSRELASELGATVIELSRDVPFTAARARNAGFAALLRLAPDLEYVQFVDGDCEVFPEWLSRALEEMQSSNRWAVICGRRKERFPEASIYNRLCDMEWNTPIGVADACGGDALMRVVAVREVGGYNPDLIAGEEPDLCLRMRRRGWSILRIDADMTLHDAAMTRFSQWWKRSVRAGHAFAEGSARHGDGPERHWVRETRSNWLWGLALPTGALLLAIPSHGTSLWLLSAYGVLGARIHSNVRKRFAADDALLYSAFCVIGKFPQAFGQASYWYRKLAGRRSELIEYKSPA
jgi:glycosyltransferase involved in cell wall biosynthesis